MGLELDQPNTVADVKVMNSRKERKKERKKERMETERKKKIYNCYRKLGNES